MTLKDELLILARGWAEEALQHVETEIGRLQDAQKQQAAPESPIDPHESLRKFFFGPLASYHVGRLKWALNAAKVEIDNGDWWGELHQLLEEVQSGMTPAEKRACLSWEKYGQHPSGEKISHTCARCGTPMDPPVRHECDPGYREST